MNKDQRHLHPSCSSWELYTPYLGSFRGFDYFLFVPKETEAVGEFLHVVANK